MIGMVEPFGFFCEMWGVSFEPDDATMVTILHVCARLEDLGLYLPNATRTTHEKEGKQINKPTNKRARNAVVIFKNCSKFCRRGANVVGKPFD